MVIQNFSYLNMFNFLLIHTEKLNMIILLIQTFIFHICQIKVYTKVAHVSDSQFVILRYFLLIYKHCNKIKIICLKLFL